MEFNRKPCEDSGYLLWQISNIWQKKMNDVFSQYHITHVQYLLLATIVWMDKQGMEINQKSLAFQARSHKMMTSKVIRTLEKNGYVERTKNLKDTRHKVISLTRLGRDKYEDVNRVFQSADKGFFGKFEMNRFSLNRIFTDMLQEERFRLA